MDKDTKDGDVVVVENSRRTFFKRAAAAVGMVATAGYTGKLISRAAVSSGDAGAKNAADVAAQEKAVKANQLVMMSDDEKKQRLDDLLNIHRGEIS
jgi:hypothetical protein